MVSTTEQHHHQDASPLAALGRVIEASQRMVVDRLELIRLEVKEAAGGAARAAALGGAGLGACALGWIALMLGLALFLGEFIAMSASFALIGLAHLIVGGILLLLSRKQPHTPRLEVHGDTGGSLLSHGAEHHQLSSHSQHRG